MFNRGTPNHHKHQQKQRYSEPHYKKYKNIGWLGGGGGEHVFCQNIGARSWLTFEPPGHARITVSRFGLAVRRQAGKQKGLGSIPLRLSILFKKVVVCGHCRVILFSQLINIKMALNAAHLTAGVILVVTV